MEKRIYWGLALCKLQLCKPVLWVQMVILILLLWLVGFVSVPRPDNLEVLLCNEDGAFAQNLIERLKHSTGAFQFREVESREALFEELESGNAECGFICNQGLEAGLKQEKTNGLVTFVSVSGGQKGAGAGETVYQELFSMYSDLLLEHRAAELFEPPDLKEGLEYLRERNAYYKNSGRVFQVIYETVEQTGNRGEQSADETSELKDQTGRGKGTDPVRGIAAMVILLQMLLICGEEKAPKGACFEACLPIGARSEFRLQKYLIGAAPLAIVSLCAYVLLKINQPMILEALRMIGFLLFSAVWVLLVGGRIKSRASYYGWLCPLIGLNLLLPPVFFQLSAYVPAVRWLNYLLPVGVYL